MTRRGSRQLSLFVPKRRRGGRKAAPGAKVWHRERPALKWWNPVHVTMRAVRGLPNFRTQRIYAAFERALRDTRRTDFHIVEFSIQRDHIHLIIEARDKGALARGMKSFAVRANRLFNSATERGRGRVWGDRYHRRDLTSPRQVRNALVYCIHNWKKHQRIAPGVMRIDFCSSARWFEGWLYERPPDARERPTEKATTVLLTNGWKKHGLIHPGETPHHAS